MLSTLRSSCLRSKQLSAGPSCWREPWKSCATLSSHRRKGSLRSWPMLKSRTPSSKTSTRALSRCSTPRPTRSRIRSSIELSRQLASSRPARKPCLPNSSSKAKNQPKLNIYIKEKSEKEHREDCYRHRHCGDRWRCADGLYWRFDSHRHVRVGRR